jgi:hypothetical protein
MGLRSGIASVLRRVGYVPRMELEAVETRLIRETARASGVAIEGLGRFTYEKTGEIGGSERWDTLDRMENDPHIKGSLRSVTLPLTNGEWKLEPASDRAVDVEARDLVAANLLREVNDRYGREYWVTQSWRQRQTEELRCLVDGFSLFSLSMRQVESKWVFDQIKWLEPSSVDPSGWKLGEDDSILEIQRTYKTPGNVFRFQEPLDVNAIALYVWDHYGARYEGRPMIRSMFGAWKRKLFIQNQAAIWAQKVGAPVPIVEYPHGTTPDQVQRLLEFVQSLRGTAPAEAFGLFRKAADGTGVTVSYAGATTDVERGLRQLVDGENAELAHGGGTKSELLGETQQGNRAVGSEHARREMLYVSAVGKVMSEIEMHGIGNLPGLIERIVAVNFPSAEPPHLEPPRPDPLIYFEHIKEAWSAGIIPHHESSRRYIVEQMFGLDLPDEAYEVQEPQPIVMPTGANGGQPPNEAGETAEAVALAARQDFERRIAPLLEPVEEGAPMPGGRFPESAGAERVQSRRGRRHVPRGRARHAPGAQAGA